MVTHALGPIVTEQLAEFTKAETNGFGGSCAHNLTTNKARTHQRMAPFCIGLPLSFSDIALLVGLPLCSQMMLIMHSRLNFCDGDPGNREGQAPLSVYQL